MTDTRGIPLQHSRSAHDVTIPELHASDVEDAALTIHNPLPGAAGGIPVSDGTNWVLGDAGDITGFTHAILSAVHTDTLVAGILDGDILIGNVTPLLSRLAIIVPGANVRNVLGIDNAELRPSWKIALDATNPTTIGVSDVGAPGTSLIFSHRDHQHPSPATFPASAHAVFSTVHSDATATSLNVPDGGTIGQVAGPLLTFDDTLNKLLLSGANLGIGVTTTAAHLEVVGDATPCLYLSQYSNDNTSAGIRGRKARGTIGAPSAIIADDGITLVNAYGYHSGGAFGANATGVFGFYAAEGFTAIAQGTYFEIATTPIGSIVRVPRLRITDAGLLDVKYQSYFEGNVGVGMTPALYQLDVAKTVKAGTAAYLNTRMLDFDGDNDYVACGDTTELNAVATFSFSVWVKQDVVPSPAVDYLFRKYNDANNAIRLYTNGGNLYILIRNAAAPTAYVATYSNYMTAGQWHHIAVVYNGAGAADADRTKIYIDNVLMTLTFTGSQPATTANLATYASWIGLNTTSWDGGIYDFRIYSTAISAANVTTIFQGGIYTTNMVHQYLMMEGTGTTVTDTGSNPLNGTISGCTWTTSGNSALGTDFGRGLLVSTPNTTGPKDGHWFGYDVDLYRSAADTLKTDDNLIVGTNLTATGKFGCNAATAQAAYASGGALAAYVTGAFGLDSDAHMSSLHALVVAMRAALVANGIMS